MKDLFLKIAIITGLILSSINLNAQCQSGETEVTIEFSYDGPPSYYGSVIQWDYIAGGLVSENGPFSENDIITTCVPDGDLIILSCDELYGFGWVFVNFTITITEDGSVNGCDALDGCLLYTGDDSNTPDVSICNYGPGFPTSAVVQLDVGPCDTFSGCTNPAAANYSSCATTDDGSCILPAVNDNCVDAIPLVIESMGNCPGNSILINNTANSVDYISTCGLENPVADIFYSFIVPPTGTIELFRDPIDGGAAYVTILNACNGIEYYCNAFSFIETIGNLPIGEELILQVWQSEPGGYIEFCIEEAPTPPAYDLCETAVPICGPTAGSNFDATFDISDPITNCIGNLWKSAWYSFEADGSGNPIDINVTQTNCDFNNYYYDNFNALQTEILLGSCGGPFTEIDCQTSDYYDTSGQYSLSVANPVAGETYFLYIDSYGFSSCDFLIEPSGGIQPCSLCEDQISGQIIAPFECDLSGIAVIISTINDDGSETIVGTAIADATGNYLLGNPGNNDLWACGNYSAMLMLPLPDCFADAGGNTGPTGPITFAVDGDGNADGAIFAVNAEVPTLSQWGLIIMALLLMSFGTIKLSSRTFCFNG